jgi:hypothetical protein
VNAAAGAGLIMTGPGRDAGVPPDPALDPHAAGVIAAAAGAGLVVTGGIGLTSGAAASPLPGLDPEAGVAAWQRIVDQVHGLGALIIARLALPAIPPDAVPALVERAASAGFDAILLDPYAGRYAGPYAGPYPGDAPEAPDTPDSVERLPAAVAAARAGWRAGGWIAAAIRDRPAARAAVIGHAAQLVRAGAGLLWVSAPGDAGAHGARLAAAPLADRLRNELGVATAIECGDALLPDLDAAIGAGRADIVAVSRLPDGVRRAA